MAADLPLPPPENQKSICHLPSPYGAWSRTAARQPLCCSRPLLFSLQLLIGLKNIFARQLPNMPREYIKDNFARVILTFSRIANENFLI
ncbi:uncharacterized protein LOC131016450 isoform X3 [Salvia miltiorrhiza]|uniref:uncharacterized protein LOC131016450 isoform X3 n=1 Tax=Salvia miltiorrhiza TaxID=226208 RepID=UPI0025AC5411|nr:uncharacterized protein LOC131016450 isoform X3 [Salvia miltiorrhiza]